MRTHGTLSKWNEARGFGFISPGEGGSDVFVHVSSMPRDGMRPRLGEVLSYEVEAGPDGKSRAARVLRPGSRVSDAAASRRKRTNTAWAKKLVGWLAVIVAGLMVYHFIQRDSAIGEAGVAPLAAPSAAPRIRPAERSFRCDGRTRCPQVASCEEATWVLKHCPGTEMDGDGDGVPCESQWCE